MAKTDRFGCKGKGGGVSEGGWRKEKEGRVRNELLSSLCLPQAPDSPLHHLPAKKDVRLTVSTLSLSCIFPYTSPAFSDASFRAPSF